MSKLLLILHLVIISSQALPQCQESFSGNARLCSKVKDYSKSQFPLPQPCIIKSEFNIRQLLQFNVDEQTFTLMIDLVLQWSDDRVTSEGSSNTNWFPIIQTNDVWVPTIHFPGAVTVEKIGTKLGYDQNVSEFSMKESMILKMTCPMNLTSVPFDHQVCDISFVNYLGKEDRIVFETALVLTKDEDIKSGSLPFTPKVKSVPTSIDEDGFSQGAIRFALIRHPNHIYQLFGSFYLPSAIFAIISMLSFFIKPEIVPGRMGMIVTLYLILINTYTSVAAPNGRGFSFYEIWYVGVQIPIVFAFLEYGIILYVIRKHGMEWELGFGAKFQELIFKVDKGSFVLSTLYIVTFIITYSLIGAKTWNDNQKAVLSF